VAASVALAALLVLGIVGTSVGLVRALQAERKATHAAERARAAEVLATDRLVQVTQEKERATAAEGKAKDEAAAAEAVVNFLQKDLLAQADPEQNARIKKVTVEEVLGRAAARIEGKFAQQPLVEAKIRQTIGKTYRALGNDSAARPHLERAWAIYLKSLGAEDHNSLHALTDLAGLYRAPDAEPVFDKVLKVRRRVLGEEHPDTIDAMINLAEAYRNLDRDSDAERLLLRTLDISRRALGEEKSQTLNAMNNLATLYSSQGQHEKAEPLLEKVLEVLRRVEGQESPHSIIAMNNLAQVYVARGAHSKAADVLDKTLDISRRVRGEEHEGTLRVMKNLGEAYWYVQGAQLKAADLLAKTLDISRRVCGDNHELTLQVMKSLAQSYWYARKLDRSIPLYEEVIPKLRKHFGPDHWFTTQAMADLGWVYEIVGRLPESIAILEQAWELDRKRLGPQADPSSLTPLMLANHYVEAGRFASAEPLYRAALAAARKQDEKRPRPTRTLHLLDSLSGTLLKQQKFAEAEPLLRESLMIREQIQPDIWRTFHTKSLLGDSLLGQKKYATAEPLLLSGYEGMKRREQTMPPDRERTLMEANERLVQLYEAWGKPGKADAWRARLGRTDLPADVFAGP
jgi:tetratricopeptide (TPR) repeat protein